jgi:allophanate hydrolase subunit 1
MTSREFLVLFMGINIQGVLILQGFNERLGISRNGF